jgi:hypothetical protein
MPATEPDLEVLDNVTGNPKRKFKVMGFAYNMPARSERD